jgi:hypothetical protein
MNVKYQIFVTTTLHLLLLLGACASPPPTLVTTSTVTKSPPGVARYDPLYPKNPRPAYQQGVTAPPTATDTAPPPSAPVLTPPKATTSTPPPPPADNQLSSLAFDMAHSNGRIAAMSQACELWPIDYWNVKVLTVEVRHHIDGLAEAFRQSVLKAVDELLLEEPIQAHVMRRRPAARTSSAGELGATGGHEVT